MAACSLRNTWKEMDPDVEINIIKMQSRKQVRKMQVPKCSPYKRWYRTSSQVSKDGWQVHQGGQGHDTHHPSQTQIESYFWCSWTNIIPYPEPVPPEGCCCRGVHRHRGPSCSLSHSPSCHWIVGVVLPCSWRVLKGRMKGNRHSMIRADTTIFKASDVG